MTAWIDRRYGFLLAGACVALALLWLPGLQYPIVSDTAQYALLGDNIWHGRGYVLFGIPYAKHLPLHAVVSYPLVAFAGFSVGMKLSSLLAGMGVLIVSFFLCRRQFGSVAGICVVAALLLHHGFVWMTVVGSADLLFSALALGGVLAFLAAERNPRWYVAAGILIGLASLTRYNGVPLFGFLFLAVLLFRRSDLRSRSFHSGLAAGIALFGVWPLRNFLVFGNALHSEYTGELAKESLGPVAQIFSNVLYYLHPLHNILPVLLFFAVYGLWRLRRRQRVLVLAVVFLECMTVVWWVQAMRFAFPAFPILLGFAAWGITDIFSALHRRHRAPVLALLLSAIAVTHLGALCLYTYGACNAAFDRTFGVLPKDLGLTPEGFHAFDQARDWLNLHAASGSSVLASDPTKPIVWNGVFRPDIRLITDRDMCPLYRITAEPEPHEEILFTTQDFPRTSVVLQRCP